MPELKYFFIRCVAARTLRCMKNIIFVIQIHSNLTFLCHKYGSGNSVGIATDYGLDGPASNPSGDEIFRPSRPALGPTQPPVK